MEFLLQTVEEELRGWPKNEEYLYRISGRSLFATTLRVAHNIADAAFFRGIKRMHILTEILAPISPPNKAPNPATLAAFAGNIGSG